MLEGGRFKRQRRACSNGMRSAQQGPVDPWTKGAPGD